ncbi:MAG TPA: hypothetical protein VFL91_30360 [Thermomicrobiales bacterium]|nr:hypothetical protein [Thermomicrobiales bacterium]
MSVVPPSLMSPLRALVDDLVAGDYAGLVTSGRAGRLTADELARAVRDYGRRLVALPEDAFVPDYVMAYRDGANPTLWSIDLTLWTAEEGRSDLTLQVLARETPAGAVITIEDLHVL